MTTLDSYTRPLFALADSFQLKLVVALGVSIVDAAMRLFTQEAHLVALIAILIVIDFVSGITASLQRGEKIQSNRLRSTGIKIVEFACLLAATTAVANSFELLSWAGTAAYFFVALTELKSIFENVSDGAAKGAVKRLRALFREKGVDGDNPLGL